MRTKKLKCRECGNEYTFHNRWVEKHVKKTGHRKFKRINDDLNLGLK